MTKENVDSALAAIGDAVSGLVTGDSLPAPIRKNAFKAFDALCSAMIDIPVAILQGKSAERRAETNARIQLINANAEEIARQMQVNGAYAQAAVTKFGRRILQQQVNLDKICGVAEAEVRRLQSGDPDSSISTESTPEISDDWLNSFREQASTKTSQEMQILFGKILAGEICRPASFSIRTVQIMGQLDSRTANLFRKLCSLAISLKLENIVLDVRVASLGGNAAQNSLIDYGLQFRSLNILQEHGLIISDYNSFMDYRPAIARGNKVTVPFIFGNKQFAFVPKAPGDWPLEKAFKIHGVGLSASGKELMGIVQIEEDEKYSAEFLKFIDGSGFGIAKVGDS
jgi:hypothetical protein